MHVPSPLKMLRSGDQTGLDTKLLFLVLIVRPKLWSQREEYDLI